MENNTSLQQQLLEAGVHFGHLKKKWNPKMLPYIFAEKKGIHIIDLNKTVDHLQEAAAAVKQIAKSGKKIMFVATKKQAKEIVSECAKRVNMPYATERWLGGMLTNFNTVRKSVKKMQSIEKMLADGSAESLTKKERLTLSRDKEKMEKVLEYTKVLSEDSNNENEAKARRLEAEAQAEAGRGGRRAPASADGAAPKRRTTTGTRRPAGK